MSKDNHSGNKNLSANLGAKNSKFLQKNLRQRQEKATQSATDDLPQYNFETDSSGWIDVTNINRNSDNHLLSANESTPNQPFWVEKNFTENSFGLSAQEYKNLNYFSAASTFAGLVGNVAQTYALEQGNSALPRNLVFNNYNRLPDAVSMAALGLCLRMVLKGFNSLPLGELVDRYSSFPTSQPSSQPSGEPTSQPSEQPTSQPSHHPSEQPTSQPSLQPSSQPTSQPTDHISISRKLQQQNATVSESDNNVYYEEYVSEYEAIFSVATALVGGISALAGTICTCCSIRSRASSIEGAVDIMIKHGNHGAIERVIKDISSAGGGHIDEDRELKKIKDVFDSPQCCSLNMAYRAENFQDALRKMSNGARTKIVDNLRGIMNGGGEREIDESDLRNRLLDALSPSRSPSSSCGEALTGGRNNGCVIS